MSKSKTFFEQFTLPVIELHNSFGTLKITTYGAHILSYIPAGKEEVLWLSDVDYFVEGFPIRGGIPVCFPWFGPKRESPGWPLHGFVRTRFWDVLELDGKENSRVRLGTHIDGSDNPYGYSGLDLEYTVSLGENLEITLSVSNTGNDPVRIENGLHSYFKVKAETCRFSSFSGLTYYDKPEGYRKKTRTGDFTLSPEREIADFYMDANTDNTLFDYHGKKRVNIKQKGFKSAIVWNPGREAGMANAEIKDQWNEFVCLESANCIDNAITLNPGEKYSSALYIGSEEIYE